LTAYEEAFIFFLFHTDLEFDVFLCYLCF
jgi:hypothetical protein